MLILGLDPGKSGGIATICGKVAFVDPMPESPAGILALLRGAQAAASLNGGVIAFLEKSQPMPRQGVVSVYGYGHHNGFIEGCLQALGIPYTLLKPQVWQKTMHVGADSKLELKERSVQIAQRLFPQVSLLPTPRCKKPSDGMAEALLIAEHGRRESLGLQTVPAPE